MVPFGHKETHEVPNKYSPVEHVRQTEFDVQVEQLFAQSEHEIELE
jgi:hypothetical protein